MNTNLLKSILVLSGIAMAASAHATTYNLAYNADPGPTLSATDVGNIPLTNVPGSSAVNDNWNFVLSASGATAGVVDFNLTSSFNITSFNVSLYDQNGTGGPGALVVSGITVPVGSFDTVSINVPGSGAYDLLVTGTAGSGGGSYSGTVSAVPLPAAAWLLLSGLVGVGAMARRRKIEKIDA
jgi:hypothetical protein